jgi:hypothetical protein
MKVPTLPSYYSMSIIFYGPPNKVWIFTYQSYITADNWKFGWSYKPNNIHINHVHKKKQCSSRYYSLKTLFITTLSLKIQTLLTTYSYYSYRHYSLFVSESISSHFLSFFHEGKGCFTLWPKAKRPSISTNQIARNQEVGLSTLHTRGQSPKTITI